MNPYILHYVISGLKATPHTYTRLLAGISDVEADLRPDPERFTIREAIAHQADWEEIFLARGKRIRDEEVPTLPGYDEGQLAIERDYATIPVSESLQRFVTGRAALMEFFEGLTEEQWQRTGLRSEIGHISLTDLAIMILGHDGYHAQQFCGRSA